MADQGGRRRQDRGDRGAHAGLAWLGVHHARKRVLWHCKHSSWRDQGLRHDRGVRGLGLDRQQARDERRQARNLKGQRVADPVDGQRSLPARGDRALPQDGAQESDRERLGGRRDLRPRALLQKKKEDYPGLLDMRRPRAAAAVVGSDGSAPSFTVQKVDRGFPKTVASRQVSSNWTILMPTADILDEVLLDMQTPTPEYTAFFHVDSDLLPEGSISTVEVAGGEVQAIKTQGNGTQQQKMLVISAKPGSSANNANTSIIVNLAPTVEQTNSSRFAYPNVTIFDDAVTLFLNSTGNLFVLANESFVYVGDVHFRVAGSGFLQVEIGEIRGKAGVSAALDFFGAMAMYRSITDAVIQNDKLCLWSADMFSMIYNDKKDVAADAAFTDTPRCEVTKVPVKVGGSEASCGSTEGTGKSSESSGGESGSAKGTSRSSSASSTFFTFEMALKSTLVALVAVALIV